MSNGAWKKAISHMKNNGGYARSRDLRAAGVHPSVLPALASSGTVVRLKRGLYVLASAPARDEMMEAVLSVPGSTLCLGSALSFHKLTTWEPPQIHLAVKEGRRVEIPRFPPMQLYHFSAKTFELGLMERPQKAGILRVYDAERTVCDLFRFRRRLGADMAAAALREYMKRRSRNITKLLDYADRLRISGPVRGALEILL